jgi:hypothetical protein
VEGKKQEGIYTSNGVIINISSHYILRLNQCSRLIGEMENVNEDGKKGFKRALISIVEEIFFPSSYSKNRIAKVDFFFCAAMYNANTR